MRALLIDLDLLKGEVEALQILRRTLFIKQVSIRLCE